MASILFGGFYLLAQETPSAGSGDTLGALITSLTIFALAIFVGFEVISKVPPTLHTPLMSGSNAISGITIIGAVICAGRAFQLEGGGVPLGGIILGLMAVALATINVVGGFLVTNRMLLMFKERKKKDK